mmetsp:Transcript_7553/g.10827  ORF Transcript_7553/g.10827 Transcript_7553/m.10827 type:complete len:104 (+) Transcript_7553:941-1252(+)
MAIIRTRRWTETPNGFSSKVFIHSQISQCNAFLSINNSFFTSNLEQREKFMIQIVFKQPPNGFNWQCTKFQNSSESRYSKYHDMKQARMHEQSNATRLNQCRS